MKKLSRNEWIGASVGVLFVAYMFFGGEASSFLNYFKNDPSQEANVINTNQNKVAVQDLAVGNGKVIESGMQVAVNYVLKLADGTIIQDSKQVGDGQSFKFIAGAGQLIPGWEQGILGMKVGGKRVITIK